ncbi:MAG TPA: hypothetical protein VGF15_02850 [Solirubrobacteraceae bacterium]|jgi:hypothetical protein
MYEDSEQPDLVIRVQREIAARMRELDRTIDLYAKLVVELELLELQARAAGEADGSGAISNHPDQQAQ